jgi:hypothetical protein
VRFLGLQKNGIKTRTFYFIFSALILLGLGYFSIPEFLKDCSNLQHIGWDPVSRFQTSLEIADGIRSGKLYVPIAKFLDSPTWPSLRSQVEALLIVLFGPNTLISIYLTIATLIVLLLLAFFLLIRNSIFPMSGFLFGVIATIFLVMIPSFLLYGFSGMLEIQGAVFFLLSVEGILLHKKFPELLPLSAFLLLQTKYPYSFMLLFAISVYLPIFYKNEFNRFLILWKRKYIKFSYRNPIILFLPIPITVLILGKFGLLSLTGKAASYLLYSIVLLLVLDGILFLYRQKRLIFKISPNIQYFIHWTYIPSILWLAIHPDRFIATTNTIAHTQGESGIFLYGQTILSEIPHSSALIVAILIGVIVKNIICRITQLPREKFDFTSSRGTTYLAIGLAIVIGQSIFTPNQQERHIYHLYPTLILGGFFFIDEAFGTFYKSYKRKLYSYIYVGILGIVFITLILELLYTSPNVCYAGQKEDIRQYPDWVNTKIDSLIQVPTILWNEIDRNHTNRPDTEVIFSIESYKKKIPILIDPNLKKLPSGYNQLIRISFTCSTTKMDQLAEIILPNLSYEIETMRNSRPGCIEIIRKKN